MAVALVLIFVTLVGASWLVLADREKSSYQRDNRVVSLALCVLSILAFVMVLRTLF